MTDAYFFGYGSLVNRLTHGYMPAHPATAHGWRRAWRYTPDRQVAYLTAIPDADCTIQGLIAPVPGRGWATLDLREHAYERLQAEHQVDHDAPDARQIAIYAIAAEKLHLPDDDHPVLLSYIDVVIQGFLAEYGLAGVEAFFETTTGWEAPILDDRAAPRYPRAQQLTDHERDLVDRNLRNLDCSLFSSA